MKKAISALLALTFALCGALRANGGATETPSPILIAYFSRVGNTDFAADADVSSSASIASNDGRLIGNAGIIAEYLALKTGGDLFFIATAEKYPVSYQEMLDRASIEGANEFRPELAAQIDNMAQYDTVYLVYPNWWGDLPTAVYAFLEAYDFSGKTVIPFATSGGSGFSDTVRTIAELLPGALVTEGIAIAGGRVNQASARIDDWLSEIEEKT